MLRLVMPLLVGFLTGLSGATIAVVQRAKQAAVPPVATVASSTPAHGDPATSAVSTGHSTESSMPHDVAGDTTDSVPSRPLTNDSTSDSSPVAPHRSEDAHAAAVVAAKRSAAGHAAHALREAVPAATAHASTPAPAANSRPGGASVSAAQSAGGSDAALVGPPERRLAKYFGAMPPKDAAKILEQMDDRDIQTILGFVGDRQAAAILGNLSAQRAAAVGRATLRVSTRSR